MKGHKTPIIINYYIINQKNSLCNKISLTNYLRLALSALKPLGLPCHVFYHNVIYIPEGCAVFQHLPWRIGMKMYFYEFLVSHGYEAVAFYVFHYIVVYFVLRKILSLYQKLCVIFIIKNSLFSLCYDLNIK